ncbi:MAG TPA: peptidoglycan bridge formation glycyltransferase FemA/FemB family protein [Ktedonobacteraceae bacterium]|nr:peptidoglycan bridge formation glycyltransferase FemA/FemB family protein [Ktedonobacteraceae bacterium]
MEITTSVTREQWNDFLSRHPYGHLLQSYEWGELHQLRGGRIYRLGALERGSLVGTMMLNQAFAPFPGLRFSWLYCARGPAVEGPSSPALPALIDYAHKIARQEQAVVLRLEPNIADDDPDLDAWLATFRELGFQTNPIAVHGRQSWVLDLRPDIEHLLANFRKAWRYNIRYAESQGVRVRAAETEEDFETYYRLLQETSKREKFFIHDKEHHRQILRLFARNGDAVLFLAELDRAPIAAKLVVRFGSWCWDMFGASSDAPQNFPRSHLIQYRCLLWAREKGCTYFDFRTIPEVLDPNEELWGVYQFKKGFGGFPRMSIPTQDYVYRSLIYEAWHKAVEVRRAYRQRQWPGLFKAGSR